jgi:type IV pilus assembly protein PilA
MQPGAPPPKKKGTSWILILAIIGGALVFAMGPCSVMAIYGVRKYIANAKTAEARNTVGFMAKLAVDAYTRDGALCPSASYPVPGDMKKVRGAKYAAQHGEWVIDASRHAGFACLGFEMAAPQYFQYAYESDGTSFTITARGDLNGDDIYSTFILRGAVQNGAVVAAAQIEETNPEE